MSAGVLAPAFVRREPQLRVWSYRPSPPCRPPMLNAVTSSERPSQARARRLSRADRVHWVRSQ